ncbi:hypothetical protein AcidC75_32660 [Acidisoma sp. C75]
MAAAGRPLTPWACKAATGSVRRLAAGQTSPGRTESASRTERLASKQRRRQGVTGSHVESARSIPTRSGPASPPIRVCTQSDREQLGARHRPRVQRPCGAGLEGDCRRRGLATPGVALHGDGATMPASLTV